jgi:hypothetical protein
MTGVFKFSRSTFKTSRLLQTGHPIDQWPLVGSFRHPRLLTGDLGRLPRHRSAKPEKPAPRGCRPLGFSELSKNKELSHV